MASYTWVIDFEHAPNGQWYPCNPRDSKHKGLVGGDVVNVAWVPPFHQTGDTYTPFGVMLVAEPTKAEADVDKPIVQALLDAADAVLKSRDMSAFAPSFLPWQGAVLGHIAQSTEPSAEAIFYAANAVDSADLHFDGGDFAGRVIRGASVTVQWRMIYNGANTITPSGTGITLAAIYGDPQGSDTMV